MIHAFRFFAPAAMTLMVAAIATQPAVADNEAVFAFDEQPGQHLDIRYGDRVVARYMTAFDPQRWDETARPYLHVMDATGKQPITKGPGGLFPHHRGIFIGYSRLRVGDRTYNLWGMGGGAQVHQEFSDRHADADQARFTSLVQWQTKDGQPLLEERRTFVFNAVSSPELVDVEVLSELTALAAPVTLDGDPEHAGVQYRAADELDTDATRYVFPAEDNDPRTDPDLAWSAMQYVLDVQTYGVVQMNHPSNPQQTIWSAYRDYGRFGAFPTAEIAEGQTLPLRYRFWITAGPLPEREQIQVRVEDYAS